MADEIRTVTLTLHDMPHDEASALAQLLKRMTYDDCLAHASRETYGKKLRKEADVMWSGVCLLQRSFADAGFAPR